MQAIILAAGMGKRLGEFTQSNTKCMVPVNGTPLIDRLLSQLSKLNLNRVVIVVGYEGEKLKQHVGELISDKTGSLGQLKVEFVDNPIYDRTNNIYSLAMAKKQLVEDDTLLIESDLILEDAVFTQLLTNDFPNLALVAKYESWNDGTMVCIDDDNNIVNFVTKQAFNYQNVEQYYKTVNIYKFSKEFLQNKYVPFLDAYTKAVGNNEYYENVLRVISFLNSHELRALPTTHKWYEIDDKQDLDIAEALFAEEKDVLRKYYGRYGGFWRFPKMLDFCYLVNPYFAESRIMEEMKANFLTLVSEYPSGMKVNSLLASKCWGIREEYVIPGNGAAELIKALMELLPGTLGIVRPTFEEYPNRRDGESLITYVPERDEFRYDADDLISYFGQQKPDSLLIINPDNPTGNFISLEGLYKLAAWCEAQQIRLVVDESFVDFAEGSQNNTLLRNDILERYPHLVVMKSISKSYGVPGLRLGILCSADKAIIAQLKKMVSIWNINSFAEFFMQIFNKYEKDYAKACEKFIAERNRFEALLKQVPFLRVMPSQANYFLCEVDASMPINSLVIRMLKEHNILTRDCSDKRGFDGKTQFMRIAVRSKEDNDRLIAALLKILAQ